MDNSSMIHAQGSHVISSYYEEFSPAETITSGLVYRGGNYNFKRLKETEIINRITNKFDSEKETSNLFNNEVADSIDYEYFEGFVYRISDETYTVDLYNVSNQKKVPKYQAELQKCELTEKEQEELEVGSKVHVELGKYFVMGEVKHTYKAQLIPLPPIYQKDIEAAYKKANEFLESIGKHETS